jgi:hypothetical protein
MLTRLQNKKNIGDEIIISIQVHTLQQLNISIMSNMNRIMLLYPLKTTTADASDGAVKGVCLRPLIYWDWGVQIPPGTWIPLSSWVVCALRYRSLRWTDHSYSRDQSSVVCLNVIQKPQEWEGLDPRRLSSHEIKGIRQKHFFFYYLSYPGWPLFLDTEEEVSIPCRRQSQHQHLCGITEGSCLLGRWDTPTGKYLSTFGRIAMPSLSRSFTPWIPRGLPDTTGI